MPSAPATHLPRIQVHPDGRFLMTDQGKPFFWLADTAWELFHRLTRDEARRYFANRSQKGFNVIQAVRAGRVRRHPRPQRLWRHALARR